MIITSRVIHALCLWSVHTASIEAGSSRRYWRHQAPRALKVCQEVARRAQNRGLDPLEVIAVSYVETRHNRKLVSSAGAVGPLQALPKYWARKGDRDHITAGLRAWAYFRRKSSGIQEAAGRYNGAGEDSHYAVHVATHFRALQMVARVAEWPK